MLTFNKFTWIALILLIIGGLNWGLVGLFQFDLVGTLFGVGSIIARLIYILVAVSAVYLLYLITLGATNTK